MLPFGSMKEAEMAMGRPLTWAECVWFSYSAQMSDFWLYGHNIVFLRLVFSLVPLPLVFMELKSSKVLDRFKLQPKIRLPSNAFFKCYMDVMISFFFVVGPLQLLLPHHQVGWDSDGIAPACCMGGAFTADGVFPD